MRKIYFFTILFSILFFSINLFAQDGDIEKVEILVQQDNEPQQEIEDTSYRTEFISSGEVKGMHLTTRAAASSFHKTRINDLLDTTELNAVVIDIKEIDGEISVKNVAGGLSYTRNLPSVESYLNDIKEKGFYAIARIVVFRDNVMPRKKPELAVKNPDGTLWEDYKHLTWLNPYKQGAIDYVLELAEKTADMGFDEIQFDYIRFPSDGRTKDCRYGVNHSSVTASAAIVNFLKQAHKRLSAKGIKISIDVFGLTTTVQGDMGIGQKIVEMAEHVDYVSPMIYPSHYANGEYGIPNPNKEPYRTVYIALQGAKKRLPVEKLRPWLQDFSMRGVKYGPAELNAQIQACYDCGVKTWLLWNAACRYTKDGLKTKNDKDGYEKTSDEKIKELLKYQNPDEAMQKRANYAKAKPKTATATGAAVNSQNKTQTLSSTAAVKTADAKKTATMSASAAKKNESNVVNKK